LPEREAQGELAPESIAVRSNMTENGESPVIAKNAADFLK
jgi:hypothetical protein